MTEQTFDLTLRGLRLAELTRITGLLGGTAIAQHTTTVAPTPMPGASDADDGPTNVTAPTADKNGLPWDERIHAKTKALNADGSWRTRRGVDAAMVASVEAELRARGPQAALPPGPPMQFAPPSTQPQMQFAPPVSQMPPPNMPQTPLAPPPPAAPPPMPPAAAPTGIDFNSFMVHLSGKMATQAITTDYLVTVQQRLAAHLGRPINVITDVASDQHSIDSAVWLMHNDGKW